MNTSMTIHSPWMNADPIDGNQTNSPTRVKSTAVMNRTQALTLCQETNPTLTTTQRQHAHAQDMQQARTEEKAAKDRYRKDLQRQVIDNIMRREK